MFGEQKTPAAFPGGGCDWGAMERSASTPAPADSLLRQEEELLSSWGVEVRTPPPPPIGRPGPIPVRPNGDGAPRHSKGRTPRS